MSRIQLLLRVNPTNSGKNTLTLSAEDKVELNEIAGRYGDSIDDRDWTKLRKIFTTDAVFDLTPIGSRICDGIEDIINFMEYEAAHPRTHTMTNVYCDPNPKKEGCVDLRFRLIGFIGKGKVTVASYYDTCVKTPDGWRVQHREVHKRRRDKREADVDKRGISL